MRAYLAEHHSERPDAAALDGLLDATLSAETVEVDVMTLSGLMRREGLSRIDLLKVDVEKAEADVLAGIEEADLAKIDQVVMEVHSEGRLAELSGLLERHGFAVAVDPRPSVAGSALTMLFARREGLPQVASAPPRDATFVGPDMLRQALDAHLTARLPTAMIPATITMMDALPVTANGKLDRRRLPLPQIVREFAAPRSTAERVICEAVAALTGAQEVGLADNFFALGGHSLLATRLVADINAALGSRLELADVFTARTVGALAALAEALAPPTSEPAVPSDTSEGAPAEMESFVL